MATAIKKTAVKTAVKTAAAKKVAANKVALSASSAPVAAAAPAAGSGLSLDKVKAIMRFHLKNLNTSGQPTSDETVLGDALSELSVAGMSARELFKALTRRDIVRNGGNDKPWPATWAKETVTTLAPKLAD